MASTNTKTVNTTGVTYDSGANISQNWIEVSPAGANIFAVEDNTLFSSLKVLGSGDTVYIEANFADFRYKQNGKTITVDNGLGRGAITLSSMSNKVQVTTTLVFLDGSVTLSNKAGSTRVSINGFDDNGKAASQLLTTKYADVKINADDSNTAAATYFSTLPVNDTTTLPLTTSIDTINFAAVVGANTVTSGLQDSAGTGTSTWNTGDSIIGNNLTNVSLIGNGQPNGGASIVTVANVAAINMNLVTNTDLNAGQFSNVAAVNVTNGVEFSSLNVSNATLSTTYGVSSARAYLVLLAYAGATGTADTAKLSASGTGTSTTATTTFEFSTGNVIEAVTLATSGTNFLTVNGGTGAATITVTGAGTNEVTIGSAAATLTYDASATTGNNTVNAGTLLSTTDIFKGGTGTADELIADLTSATQMLPTITGIEELELTFTAAATFNAVNWTGGNELDLTPTGAVVATVTNLNQTVTTLGIGEAAAIAATGAVNIGYASGANSAVTLNVGATSTSSDPAVSSTGALTITGNAGALTINSVGDAANTLGAINANAVSALTIAGVAQNLTTGIVSATTAATVTIDGTLKNTVVTTATASANSLTVDESMTTFNLKAGAGTATLTSTNGAPGNAILQTAVSAAIATTYNITSGAQAATIGKITASTANADKNLNATINLTGGVAAITTGVLSFTGSGALTADLTNVTLNATATSGLVTIGGLTVDEDANGTSSTNVNLTANGGNVTLTTLTLTDSDATNIVVSATDGETATIGTLAGTTNLNSINVTGAGTVSLFGTGTSAVTGDTVVVASGLTGALTLGLGLATGNLNVTLGNVVSGSTNTVTTGLGADVIIGGTGADTITGGLNADVIQVGAGSDTVVFTNGLTIDVVSDFLTSGTDIAAFSLAALEGAGQIKAAVTADISGGTGVAVSAGATATLLAVSGATTLTSANVLNVTGASFASAAALEAALVVGGSRALTTNGTTGVGASDAILVQWSDGTSLHEGVVLFDLAVANGVAVAAADITVVEIVTVGTTALAAANYSWIA